MSPEGGDEEGEGRSPSPALRYLVVGASGALQLSGRRQTVADLSAVGGPLAGLEGVVRGARGGKDPARRRSIALRQLAAAQKHVGRTPQRARDSVPNLTPDLANVLLRGKVG